ncbi:CCA tRNA nucleotidyltransferase [Geoglobus acetivorans]|uniref:CCA-adding enzyme n=1 Tax=Geoglobus acetivorans TaxID=565033 RepID=A0A0A7GDY2_GEOAI|nr:tRNA nucleotidyltransferase, archaeal type [Geoglobus acetivorans]
MTDIKDVIQKVLPEVIPDENLVRKAESVEGVIRERLETILGDYPEIEYRFLGSYARNTWLPEGLEIDVFLLFPENYSFEELEKLGIEIGKQVVDSYELRYAAHPYVHGTVDGVEIDVVPCYRLKSPDRIKSAVDRTPFHHEWLKDRIRGKEDDVRLLKRFLKAGGIYGAEYKIRGFSGYLCELLIVFYGSFENLVRKASRWRRDLVIDIENGETRVEKGLQNIFVIDPVDRKRNVAANLSVDSLAKFIERCRLFLNNPSEEFFIAKDSSVSVERLNCELENRFVCAVVFERPPIVEDNLYTQLERAEKRIKKLLEENEFQVMRTGHHAGQKCYLLFETLSGEVSGVKKHYGPKIESYENSMKFIRKNREYSRFFENGRYVTYRTRRLKKVEQVIEHAIRTQHESMGKDVSDFIRNGCVYSGKEILKLDELLHTLADFLGVKG